MTSSDDMLYCYLLDIVSHLQPLSHRCQLSFKGKRELYDICNEIYIIGDLPDDI